MNEKDEKSKEAQRGMSITKMWVITLLLGALVFGLFYFGSALAMFATAALLAYLLHPLINLLENRLKLGHTVAVIFIFVGGLLFTVAVVGPMLTMIAGQLGNLASRIPVYANTLSEFISRLEMQMAPDSIMIRVLDLVDSFVANSDTYIASVLSSVATSTIAASSRILDLVLFLIALFYFLHDGVKLLTTAVDALPDNVAGHVWRLLKSSDDFVWKYLKSQVFISAITALAITIGFLFLNPENALLFGVLTFIFNFIPYLGSIVVSVIQVLSTLFINGGWYMLYAAILTLLVQQIIGNVVGPRIQAKSIGVHPVGIMLSLVICSQLWGIVGMFIAVPVAGLASTVMSEMIVFLKDMK